MGSKLQKVSFMFFEEMGFNEDEVKTIIMKYPVIWKRFYHAQGHQNMVSVFDLVHHDMSFSHQMIVNYPLIFTRRVRLIKTRHLYLQTLDRAQYDPCKPLYVPLSAFYLLDDATFCLKYAKTSVNDYNAFLKTL